jgi:hypothetical protein
MLYIEYIQTIKHIVLNDGSEVIYSCIKKTYA